MQTISNSFTNSSKSTFKPMEPSQSKTTNHFPSQKYNFYLNNRLATSPARKPSHCGYNRPLTRYNHQQDICIPSALTTVIVIRNLNKQNRPLCIRIQLPRFTIHVACARRINYTIANLIIVTIDTKTRYRSRSLHSDASIRIAS